MRRASLVFTFAVVFATPLFAQLESAWWYFGFQAGMNFLSGFPVADTNSTYAGNSEAVVSDSLGNLLFYFIVQEVINKNHEVMPNSTGLFPVAAEGGQIAIPNPGDSNQYYAFSSDVADIFSSNNENGLFYHVVDMTLDGGLGDIVPGMKNIVLIDSTSEKIAATQHANGVDYWVMVQQCGSNKYHAFLVSESGVSTTPVTTALGPSMMTYGHCEGTLRFNHRGNMFVNIHNGDMELFDFDNATGQLSNLRSMPSASPRPGIEFSADDTKLYTGGPIQFDVTLPTAAAIQASAVPLYSSVTRLTTGMQYGLDGKIYTISKFGSNSNGYMAVINNPNAAGAACNFQDSVLYLGDGRTGIETLPNFPSNFFKTSFIAETPCVGDTTFFNINYHFITNVSWNFGDPASGAANTSTLVNAFHVYDNPGAYTVTLIAQNGAVTDTVVKTIYVKETPSIDLGPDVDFCAATSDSVKLSAGNKKGQYLWSTGSTDSTLTLDSANFPLLGGGQGVGLFYLTFTNECGSDSDTIQVEAALPLSVQLPPDTALCADSFLVIPEIQHQNSYTTLLWSTGDSIDSIIVNRSNFPLSGGGQGVGNVWLTATNACGSDSASIAVTFLAQPDGVLPNDSVYCLDDAFYLLNSQSAGIQYEWNDGTTGPQYRVSESGTYWLKSASICDTLIDTFKIEFNGEPKVLLPNDTLLCPGEEVLLRNLVQNAPAGQLYAWSTGSTDSSITVFSSETGRYIVTVTLKSCSVLDSTTIGEKGFCPERCTPRIANVFSPNADGVNDVFSVDIDCRMTEVSFFIYNRWGQLVHQSGSLAMVWDGYINGIAAAEGTYYYVLQFTDEAGEQRSFRGSFSLVE